MISDRLEETSTTPGTGTFSLNGADSGMRSFVTGIGNGLQCYYVATNGIGGFEVGIGTVTDATPDTLSRDTVLISSNAGAKVNFSGTITIRCTDVAELLGAIGERLRGAATTGSSNAYAMTVRPAPRALVDKMTVRGKANFSNTGAATLNVNALGAKALRKGDGSIALAASDLLINTTFEATYDSGLDVWMIQSPLSSAAFGPTSATQHDLALFGDASGKVLEALGGLGSSGQVLTSAGAGAKPAWSTPSSVTAASQADMETASSTTAYVPPGRQHFHPGHVKASASLDSSGAVVSGYNTTSGSKTGTGLYVWTIGNDFSDLNTMIVIATALLGTTGGKGIAATIVSVAVGVVAIEVRNTGDALVDVDRLYLVALGDQ